MFSVPHYSGSVAKAVEAARSVCGFSQRIDVEVQSYEEAEEAVRAGADVVMLDNMGGDELVSCARKLKSQLGPSNVGGSNFLIESSGGIDLENVGGRMSNGEWKWAARDRPASLIFRLLILRSDIDIISTSAIHQSTKHVDFSLKIVPAAKDKAAAAANSVAGTATALASSALSAAGLTKDAQSPSMAAPSEAKRVKLDQGSIGTHDGTFHCKCGPECFFCVSFGTQGRREGVGAGGGHRGPLQSEVARQLRSQLGT